MQHGQHAAKQDALCDWRWPVAAPALACWPGLLPASQQEQTRSNVVRKLVYEKVAVRSPCPQPPCRLLSGVAPPPLPVCALLRRFSAAPLSHPGPQVAVLRHRQHQLKRVRGPVRRRQLLGGAHRNRVGAGMAPAKSVHGTQLGARTSSTTGTAVCTGTPEIIARGVHA